MVITKLIGGLGNQMFQFALGRKLSLKLSSDLKLDTSGFEVYKLHDYGMHCFDLEKFTNTCITPANSPLYRKINRFLPAEFHFGYKHVLEKCFSFDKQVLKLRGDLYLDGYWQSEKYFKEIRSTLLSDFTIKYTPDTQNVETSAKIKSCEAISLHIRRGDYVNNAQTLEKHGVCGLNYYHRAVEYTAERTNSPVFFIFSDDHEWARENLKINYPITFIVNNNASKNYEDLRLMSQCKHNIIANSSFSWWGAWLNENPDKIVIGPKHWFNDTSIDTTDLIPERWLSL